MPTEHSPVATQLAVAIGFIDATSNAPISFAPPDGKADAILSDNVSRPCEDFDTASHL